MEGESRRMLALHPIPLPPIVPWLTFACVQQGVSDPFILEIKRCTTVMDLEPLVWVNGKDFKRHHITAALQAVACFKRHGALPATQREVVKQLAVLAATRLPSFTGRELAACVYNLGKLGVVPGNGLLNLVMAEMVEGKARGMNAQEITNALHGFAKLGRYDVAVCKALTAAALERIDSFKPQGLSNSMWALATLEHHDDEVFGAFCDAA
jgi:hypothetical protein